MGYGFDLHRIPAGLGAPERRAAYEAAAGRSELEPAPAPSANTQPPAAEQTRLATILMDRFPDLKVTLASARCLELSQKQLWARIYLFTDAAGISLHTGGFRSGKCIETLRFVWDCLQILEAEGFATYDTQIDKVLDLSSDFEAVLTCLCGERAVKQYARQSATAETSYERLVAAAAVPRKPYGSTSKYTIGDLVEHPKFGVGIVRSVAASRVQILFEDGAKTLVCG